MVAYNAANGRFPDSIRADEDQRYLAQRKVFYDAQKEEGRLALMRRYNVDAATLDRIDEEGLERKWPLPEDRFERR
jgi:hypothetical protein